MSRSQNGRGANSDVQTAVGSQRVLLLDPDPKAADVLASQLRHTGFETHITSSYPAALLAIRTMHFGAIVVVADLANPASCDDLRQIRHAAPHSWLVIIADSMRGRAEELLRELGTDAWFFAPFAVADLTQRLSTLANRGRSLL